jgi:hypothetical protein
LRRGMNDWGQSRHGRPIDGTSILCHGSRAGWSSGWLAPKNHGFALIEMDFWVRYLVFFLDLRSNDFWGFIYWDWQIYQVKLPQSGASVC